MHPGEEQVGRDEDVRILELFDVHVLNHKHRETNELRVAFLLSGLRKQAI